MRTWFSNGLLPFQILPVTITKKIVMSSRPNVKDTPQILLKDFISLNKLSIKRFKSILHKEKLKILKEYYMISTLHREISVKLIAK